MVDQGPERLEESKGAGEWVQQKGHLERGLGSGGRKGVAGKRAEEGVLEHSKVYLGCGAFAFQGLYPGLSV